MTQNMINNVIVLCNIAIIIITDKRKVIHKELNKLPCRTALLNAGVTKRNTKFNNGEGCYMLYKLQINHTAIH